MYCPLKGRCPHCHSAMINANSVGKGKLCYAVPWLKTIVGVDMRYAKCKRHFMTHDLSYVKTLPSEQQLKKVCDWKKKLHSHFDNSVTKIRTNGRSG